MELFWKIRSVFVVVIKRYCYRGQLVTCHLHYMSIASRYLTIDLVLIDERVGKRSLHMMDTVHAKKRWKTLTGVSTIFKREPRSDPHYFEI
jgi:hypothetical protein